jgi:hypothetical protein
MTTGAVIAAGVIGFVAGWTAAALCWAAVVHAHAAECRRRLGRQRCPAQGLPAEQPPRVLVIREAGSAEWLATRARRN